MTYRPAQLSGPRLPASSWLASNADRERAVDVLRAGFAEGRLTQGELNERVARAYASRTYGELTGLTADLPAGPLPPGAVPGSALPDGALPGSALSNSALPGGYGAPLTPRSAASLCSPAAIAGLVLTAVVVFTLAALATGAAFYLHMHAGPHPFVQPGGPINLLPKVTRLH